MQYEKKKNLQFNRLIRLYSQLIRTTEQSFTDWKPLQIRQTFLEHGVSCIQFGTRGLYNDPQFSVAVDFP
jgi:hypothetical protein